MDEAKRDLVRAWLVKARRDLLSARVLAAGIEPILDTAIYHCQQAAEKAIKGFLAFHDHPLEKTHNVRRLVALAQGYESRFVSWHEAGELLTPYATAYRLPDGRPGTGYGYVYRSRAGHRRRVGVRVFAAAGGGTARVRGGPLWEPHEGQIVHPLHVSLGCS